MMRCLAPFLALFALHAAGPGTALARCAARGLELVVLTPSETTVPTDGSFVVGLVTQRSHGPRLREMPEGVRLEHGGRSIPVRLETIAPGLARATPAERPSAGQWQLTGPGVRPAQTVTFGATSPPPPPRAPRVRSVSFHETRAQSRRSRTLYAVTATFARPPSRAVAVAAVRSSGSGSWTAAEAPSRTMQLHPRLGRCEMTPRGFSPVRAGSEARVIVVDAFGRTAEATVTVR